MQWRQIGGLWALALGLAMTEVYSQNGDPFSGMSASLKPAAEAYEKGLDFLEAGKRDDALKQFDKAYRLASENSSADARQIAVAAANNAGNLELMAGRAEGAEKYYRQSLAAVSNHVLSLNNLGAALLKQGKIESAQAAFETALRVDPANTMAMNNLAELLLLTGNLKLAGKFLAQSIQCNETNQQTLALMIRLYDLANMPEPREKVCRALLAASGQSETARIVMANDLLKRLLFQEADRLADEILAKSPDSLDARIVKARVMAGRNPAEAVAALQAVLKQRPDDELLRNDLAVVLLRARRPAEALAVAREGTEKYPHQANNWFMVGLCQDEAGDFAAAAKNYERAVQENSQHSRAWLNLGVLEAKKNKGEQALNCFARAVVANPFDPDALYNLGHALVITQKDYERGVRMLVAVGMGKGPTAEKARTFIDDLEKIAAGKDPGWGRKSTAKTEARP